MKHVGKGRLMALELLLCLMAAAVLTGCSKKTDAQQSEGLITSVEELADKRICVEEGSAYDNRIKEMFPEAEIIYAQSSAGAVMAMQDGKLDAFIADEPFAKAMVREVQGIRYLSEMLTYDDYAFVLKKDNTELADKINEVLAGLEAEGVLEALEKEWIEAEGIQEINRDPEADTSKGVLKVATAADIEPFSFIKDGELAGYDIELITLVAERMGYEIEIDEMEFSALVTAVTSGSYDVAVDCITITEERAETLLFTEPVYHSGTVAVVMDGTPMRQGFFDELADNFRRTFLVEDRWKMICSGIAVTIGVSLGAAVLGTLLGIAFSFPLRSKNRTVRTVTNAISLLWGQTPLVVILMILYYLVFKNIDISAFWVGIVGFSLDFANAVAGLVNTGIWSVNAGEIEAAGAMGYTPWQTFRKVTLPQVVRAMYPQYEKAIVGLVKGTSIIGYITVEDLTKIGDIIRSRTYEAFFPLIATAVLYFVIAYMCVWLLEKVAARFWPKGRIRNVRGVRTE